MKLQAYPLRALLLILAFLFVGNAYPQNQANVQDQANTQNQANAQITLVNRTQHSLDLYIDGNFGCGPVLPLGKFTHSSGLFCTSSVVAGSHVLEARDGDVIVASDKHFVIEKGTSPEWTVNLPTNTVEGVWELVSDSNSSENWTLSKLRITHNGNHYEATNADPSNAGEPSIYADTGNVKQISRTYDKSILGEENARVDNRGREIGNTSPIPPEVLREYQGKKVPIEISYILSRDGKTLTKFMDTVLAHWKVDPSTGEYLGGNYYVILRRDMKATYKRIE